MPNRCQRLDLRLGAFLDFQCLRKHRDDLGA